MSFLSVCFLLLATVCGFLAFGGHTDTGVLSHVGFVLGVLGFLTLAAWTLARWAVQTLDDVPGQRVRH